MEVYAERKQVFVLERKIESKVYKNLIKKTVTKCRPYA